MSSYFIKTKWVHNLITIYLITFISSCTTPPRSVKPPTSVARAMETRSFEGDLVTILKASINSLQDMDYTIDVLNSDIGLISASRTSERRKANLANENNNSEQMSAGEQACLIAGGFVAIVVLISFLDSIFDGDSSNDCDSSIWSGPTTINNRDDGPDGRVGERVVAVAAAWVRAQARWVHGATVAVVVSCLRTACGRGSPSCPHGAGGTSPGTA